MSLKNRFVAYLDAYARKDIEEISALFTDDILLRDWKISVSGKDLAISETNKNLEAARSIEIEILNTYESADAVAGELRIVVDGLEVLFVVDVVTFNNEGKIASIRAYLGRED